MTFNGTNGLYQSVVFFDKDQIDREMQYSEFNAVLDNLVPVKGYADRTIKAVMLGIDGQLNIVSAVFFLLGFDSEGIADRKWNVPLEQLAEQATAGPNLGGGPIKLCCRSQCPVDWHVKDLWDPDMSRQPNDFEALRERVRKNRLSFKELEPEWPEELQEVVQATSAQLQQTIISTADSSEADKVLAQVLIDLVRKNLKAEDQDQTEQIKRNQQLLLAAQNSRFEDERNQLALEHSNEMREIQVHFAQTQTLLEQERAQIVRLQEQLEQVNRMHTSLQEQLPQSKKAGDQQVEALRAQFEADLSIRMQTAAREYEKQIANKDMAIASLEAQQGMLRDDISKMQVERAQLIKSGGEQFIQRLRDNSVNFMVYHQGAGNIKMDLDSIGEYLENPLAYVARVCKISEADYRAWLVHYNDPVCNAHSSAKQGVCGKKLRRVEVPEQFVVGRSNRCPLHWDFVESAAQPDSAS